MKTPAILGLLPCVLAGMLTACGGGQSGTGGGVPVSRASAASPEAAAPGAPANSRFGAAVPTLRKAATRQPVYRFYNRTTGAHFYTNSETEKNNILATLPNYTYDGVAFHAADTYAPGLSPVYRFYNTTTGVHFYTINEAEKNNILATLPQFVLEGQAYHASLVAGQGLTPLYRFYVPARGFHFYTASEQEKTTIQNSLGSTYTYEGIAYHVLAGNWTELKLPHSGVTASQCYQSGSSTLVACGGGGPLSLDNQQDGFRALYNPLAYESVNYFSGNFWFAYPFTSCVKDSVTGLVWEGKETSGDRRGTRVLTNLGNGLAGDASGYVAAVNASALCGYTDWRLPTLLELTTLQDLGQSATPRVRAASFPNTSDSYYWTSEIYASDSGYAWISAFSIAGLSNFVTRSSSYSVRLVRGSMTPAGTRFSYASASYGSDAANNIVNDVWTGLRWRRCLEGQTWSGTTCTGAPSYFTHEQALAHDGHISRDRWRLPNIKELDSLQDRTRTSPPAIDTAAFPDAPATSVWSSTPYVAASGEAYYTTFNIPPRSDITNRLGTATVRLIWLP